VSVGEGSLIGANTVIKPGVIIGSNVTIGAGSVVLRDILDGETWGGNPARKIK
jgi:acetyltransferase-like isoleucine patch superfamily enzyme